jgi:hypothetical protein
MYIFCSLTTSWGRSKPFPQFSLLKLVWTSFKFPSCVPFKALHILHPLDFCLDSQNVGDRENDSLAHTPPFLWIPPLLRLLGWRLEGEGHYLPK